MPIRTNGSAFKMQNLSPDLTAYVCYAKSPLAFTSPNPNPTSNEELSRLVNIQVTGNILDESQKNFEVFLMNIGLRAMPVILSNPLPVPELADYTNELSGEGFVWKFAVERGVQFYNFSPFGVAGPVGLLIDDTDGLVIPSGVRITTVQNSPSGWAMNVAFNKIETL